MNAKVIDMHGKRFGAIVAVRPISKCASGDLKWLFICDCGDEFEANGYYARIGKVISCKKCSAQRIGMASVKHGMSETSEFGIWTDMHTRCYNPKSAAYENYGGRGIQICDWWINSFANFFADMGPRPSSAHSIDRIDVNGDYAPKNCRWATAKEQGNNKRNNVLVTIDGVTKTLTQWAGEFNVLVGTAALRHKQGLRGADIFRTQIRTIDFNGITDTIAGWSRRTGIKKSTIGMRICQYKWPVERALTEGALL